MLAPAMLVSSRRAVGLALALGLATRLSLLTHRSAALIALAATGLVLLERLVFPGGSKATETTDVSFAAASTGSTLAPTLSNTKRVAAGNASIVGVLSSRLSVRRAE